MKQWLWLSTAEMMEETKRTGNVAVIVEVPKTLEPYKMNWIGSGMFFDKDRNKYCVNNWVKNFGYPSFEPDELKEDSIRKDVKWVIDENVEVVQPPKDNMMVNPKKIETSEVEMKVFQNNDNSEGHIFSEGDKLEIEVEKAVLIIMKRVIQIKEGTKHRGYWVNIVKSDGTYNSIKMVNENRIKDLPLITGRE